MKDVAATKPVKTVSVRRAFDRFAGAVTVLAGSPAAFLFALAVVLGWAITGPSFHFSEKWQIFINTFTTIVTFLMVFLIQQAQNKDNLALHLKLNELLASHQRASNRVVGIEDLDEVELAAMSTFYKKVARMSAKRSRNRVAISESDSADADAADNDVSDSASDAESPSASPADRPGFPSDQREQQPTEAGVP